MSYIRVYVTNIGLVLVVASVLMVLEATAAAAGERNELPADLAMCFPLEAAPEANDFRNRGATAVLQWKIDDNNRYHYQLAIERMKRGEFSRMVKADLDFLLRKWPNHYPGLQALIAYDLAGGKDYDLPPTWCYFARARHYAPTDISVYLAEAYYLQKKGMPDKAIASYKEALALDPNSADVNYLLGLLYCDLGQYQRANEHAQVAYDRGYPLAGLRKKLIAAGHWQPGVEKSVEPRQPSDPVK